jgi:tetratricopeptide (TPR) repeat protein
VARTIGHAKQRRVLRGRIDRQVAFADSLLLKGKYSEAADLYKESLRRNKNNVAAKAGLGMSLAKQFKLDPAEEQFDQVLASDPNNAQALAGKALVEFNRLQSSSNTVIRNKDSMLKDAEGLLKRSLSGDPHMPEAHYTLGMVYKEQDRLGESADEFRQAIKIDPHYSEAYSGLGVAQLAQGDRAAAMQSFKQAIADNSSNSTAHYGLGKTYLQLGRTDEAIKELNTSLALFPNSAPARLAMGEAYNNQGNTVAAVREFQESIRIKPENFDAYSHIADIRESRGDIEHSLAELRSGLELMPNNANLRQRIGDECLRIDKLDDAMKEYRNVLAVNPGNQQAAQGLTRALYLKSARDSSGAFFTSNEYQSASAMIDEAVAMNPNDMELRLAQAKIRSMSGASIDLSKVGTPTNDGERVAYAEALLAQNKFSEASTQMNIVLTNSRTGKQACAVADLALMIKDLPDAEAAYRKALSMPGTSQRAQYGLDAVAKAKDQARQDYTLASDLAHRKQLASAIDKYHLSVYENPTAPDARLGLADALERWSPKTSSYYKQAIVQLQAYESLKPDLVPEQKTKIDKRIISLQNKAAKLTEKGK